MKYSDHAIKELKKVLCKRCFEKHPNWSDDTFNSWLLYIKGADRRIVIRDTQFSSFKGISYHFEKHGCYKKIAKTRKIWFRYVKKFGDIKLNKYPWLLGLFYADGAVSNGTKLSFSLSLHEKVIVDEVVEQLKNILGSKKGISTEKVGNMYSVRFHSSELCRKFPNKGERNEFLKLWGGFNEKEKIKFVAGLVDGDGSCAFEDGINSITLYSKDYPFLLGTFHSFLRQYGYVSLPANRLYMSPDVGSVVKPFTLKKHVIKPYTGSVDVAEALEMLKNGFSVYKISKITGFNKKTILLALKRVYGRGLISKYFNENRIKKQKIYSGKYDLDCIFKMLKSGKTLNSILKYKSHNHVLNCLFKMYGEKQVRHYIRKTGKSE